MFFHLWSLFDFCLFEVVLVLRHYFNDKKHFSMINPSTFFYTPYLFYKKTVPMDLPEDPLPCIHSTPHDLLLDGRPDEAVSTLVGYMDSSWGDCLITRRSFSGCNMRLAGGPVGYKGQLLPTVALSSTEAEYMMACAAGHMSLYIRSILFDIGVPQEAATILSHSLLQRLNT